MCHTVASVQIAQNLRDVRLTQFTFISCQTSADSFVQDFEIIWPVAQLSIPDPLKNTPFPSKLTQYALFAFFFSHIPPLVKIVLCWQHNKNHTETKETNTNKLYEHLKNCCFGRNGFSSNTFGI